MFRSILFWLFIALCLAGGIYWFVYTRQSHTPVSEGINAIPQDAAIIFESTETRNTWKKLAQTNIMWEELLGTQTFGKLNQQARYADSLIGLNSDVATLADGHPLYISVHPLQPGTFGFLFVYSLPNLTDQPGLEKFLGRLGSSTPASATYGNETIETITPTGKSPFYASFVNGILMMSTSQALVQDAIRQIRSKSSLANDRSFSRILSTAGKKVDANIYINYKHFPDVITSFLLPAVKSDAAHLAHFADCSGWDVSLRPNALLLNGFTYSGDSAKTNFLTAFNKQKPQAIELTKVIPAKTALLIFYGISNTATFRADYKTYLGAEQQLAAYTAFTNSINEKYNADIEQSLPGWIDNEMALVITEPSGSDFSDNTYAVMHTENIAAATAALNLLALKADSVSGEKPDTSGYRGHMINRIRISGLLPKLFGPTFGRLENCYFTSADDYIVFGNSAAALQRFTSDTDNGHTLAGDKNYAAFAENISAEANLYIYSAIARSATIYSSFTTKELAAAIGDKASLLHKFEAAALQFTCNNKLYYSNLYLKYNPVYKKETGTLWETRLDSTLSSRPYLVINHNTKAKEVLVQDDANKIYLISNTGKVIWTRQLNEKIMSDVVQLDVLKNNKLQMLFNTRSAIYMYDRNGNDMKGFPVKLKAQATSAVSVVDYENNRDYRIFIACENKKLLCFKATGEAVEGFHPDKTENIVYLPLQYFSVGSRDHLCAVDEKGKIYILDRKGETRIPMKERLPQGIRSFCIETGKDYSKSFIVAADTLGNVMRISLAGDREKIKFQDFETSPYFDYRDLNNDKTKEYIFVTRTELKVFSADKSLQFSYAFGDKITQAPQFFLFPDGSTRIGITSGTTGELFLFNSNGSLCNSFPLKGKTPFSIGDLNNEGIYNLVTGADNSIYVYQIE